MHMGPHEATRDSRVRLTANDPCDCTRGTHQAPRRPRRPTSAHPPRAHPTPTTVAVVTKRHCTEYHQGSTRQGTLSHTLRQDTHTGPSSGQHAHHLPKTDPHLPLPLPLPAQSHNGFPPILCTTSTHFLPRLRLRPPNRRLQGRTFVRSVLASLMGGWPGAYAVRRRTFPSSPLGSRCPST
jgi:hypothetical protein